MDFMFGETMFLRFGSWTNADTQGNAKDNAEMLRSFKLMRLFTRALRVWQFFWNDASIGEFYIMKHIVKVH